MVFKNHARLWKVSVAALLLLSLSACDNGGTAGQSAAGQEPQLKAIGFQEWDRQLASYQPSVVVVDMWAMWCTSCIKRFPKMVEMNKKYAPQGVQFVSLNLDNRDDTQAVKDAEKFLKEMNATFDNFHMDENLIDAFEHFNLIGIPAVVIYDGEGKERYRLTGTNPNKQFTDKDIEAAVKELLAEKAA